MKKIMSLLILFYLLIISCRINVNISNEEEYSNSEVNKNEPTELFQGNTPLYFDMETLKQNYTLPDNQIVTPEDFLREVSFSGGIGGYESCADIEWGDISVESRIPVLLYDNIENNVEWMEYVYSSSCGWVPNEEVTLFLKYPDGNSTILITTKIDEYGQFFAGYTPDINTPPGEYTLITQGEKNVIVQKVDIAIPNEPKVYQKNNSDLYLYGFQPAEEINLLVYKKHPEYEYGNPLAWLWDIYEYKVSDKGQLIIDLDDKMFENREYGVLILGSNSGAKKVIYQNYELNLVYSNDPITPFSISVTYPTDEELNQGHNIWNDILFENLLFPGRMQYETTIKRTDDVIWRLGWCADDTKILYDNLKFIESKFLIDGVEVNKTQIREEYIDSSEKSCINWITQLTNWKANSSHELIIKLNITEEIFDGETSYSPGEYEQIILVNIE